MAEETGQDRTEAPTDKRRSEARNKGSVAKSTEIDSVVVLLVAFVFLRIFGKDIMAQIGGEIRWYCNLIPHASADMSSILLYFKHSVWVIAITTLPLCLSIMAAGILTNYLQVGWLLTWEPITPRFSKINPIAGAKRLFSVRSIFEALKGILKLVIIGVVAWITIKDEFNHFVQLADTTAGVIWAVMMQVSYTLAIRIILVMVLLAILDYIFQKWEYEKSLKMTREEVKEERKQMEGDPQIKGRIRSLQREMHRRRMMKQVPEATVVVTNPTFIAIAIRYEPTEMETPKIIAKGKRLIAEQIRKLAQENGIPIVEDKPLARAMYDKVEPGDDIPVEFFAAIAEILAYVYKLKNRMAA